MGGAIWKTPNSKPSSPLGRELEVWEILSGGSSGNQVGQGVPPVEGLMPTIKVDRIRCVVSVVLGGGGGGVRMSYASY